MGATIAFDPVHQFDKVPGHGCKCSNLLPFRCDDAGSDTFFMHIQTATSFMQHFHNNNFSLDWFHLRLVQQPIWVILPCVLPEGATICDTPGRCGPSDTRARGTKKVRPTFASLISSMDKIFIHQ